MTDTANSQQQQPGEQIRPDDDQVRTKPAQGGKAQQAPAGVSFLTCAFVALAVSGFTSFMAYHFAGQNLSSGAQVVLVDGTKLANAQMKRTLDKAGLSPEQAQADGLAFVTELQNVLKGYTDSGVLVINSSVALNAPAGLNVTGQVAQHLGLELE
ncbi:TPA: hypothetical protein ACNV18_000200 [Pseudomonas putida]|jgi:hypothetical protein|uniref:Uncharacterized protein n=3 Tax=Pseudomonas TaxID=286 RepID=A0A2A3M1E5_PSEDL|nr:MULTISPECIES: hypothetical protein [Pseudomonas]MCT8191740.1 hypothetical protein [Pseudomonas monteilii]TXG99540.1 MAG: hypothetical protein E6R08_01730 [Nevskiaceae bacterium]AGZ38262.1 hypothetical protein PVLB_27627 [Pseudomonas sp. VLB120]EKT4481287.1 hypothetical protein [Pseudomonas putida]MBA6061058.1 hypothetical protein [Pseudomonas juntendi]